MSSVWHTRDARASQFVAISTAAGDYTKFSFGIDIWNPSRAMSYGVCGEIVDVKRPNTQAIVRYVPDRWTHKTCVSLSRHGSLILELQL